MFSASKSGQYPGYQISRSVRLRQSAGGYLNRTLSASGSTSQWTYSKWTKRGLLGSFNVLLSSCITGSTYYQSVLAFDSSDRLWYYQFSNGSGYSVNVTSTAVFRDPSAWYHVVMKFDATTSSMIVWVNNQQVINSSSFSTTNRLINSNNVHYIGNYAYQTVDPGRYDGYFTEINFIDGQVLTPNSFGETNPVTGVWQPKKYAGTYGTNGFYLNFSDNSAATAAAIGKDYSGNGNNWTPNNISVTAGVTYDSMLDVPTQWADGGNGRGNYCTLNPLAAGTSSYLSGGNLNASISAANTTVLGTFQLPTSGKWYWEYQITTIAGGSAPMGGIATTSANSPAVFYRSNGDKLVDGTGSAYGATYTTTDTIGVAVDVDGGTIAFYKNNTSQGNITYSSAGFYPALRSSVSTDVFNINFGQRPFSYTPPSGFKALNTLNLPTPTIANGALYMAATTYTGTGASLAVSNAVNNVSFQPDFVWTKPRSTAVGHTLFDSLRGVTKYLQSNTTGAEGTAATSLTAFNSNGFTVNSDTSTGANGVTYVGWQWQAGAGSSSSNNSGSITSTVSVNTTAGFSIVTYTGTGANATVGHGLGVAPRMIIFRARSIVENWPTWHTNLTSAAYVLTLNTTNAQASVPQVMNSTAPTSSVFSVGTSTGSNGSGTTYVAYCFAPIAGYSAFGSYTGNGSTDGPFVFCGFRPRFVLIKESSAAGNNWVIYDTARDTYNECSNILYPNLSNAEFSGSTVNLDILSNGFKPRDNWGGNNTNGSTYIYAAFAENPFKYSLAR